MVYQRSKHLDLLMQVHKVEQKEMSPNLYGRESMSANKPVVKVDIPDIVSVSACADLTLPPGAGLCIDTTHGPVFLVSILFPFSHWFVLPPLQREFWTFCRKLVLLSTQRLFFI